MQKVLKTWYKPLHNFLQSDSFNKKIKYLDSQYELSKFVFNKIKIYPEKKKVFKCFNCDFNKLKVVFIGSEPFGEYSEGLAFDSTDNKIDLHPISELIRYTIEHEFHNGFALGHDFSLEYLMKQDVLLLNESLTTTNQKDHKELWKEFIVEIINIIQLHHTGIIFCIEKNSDLINYVDVKNQYLLLFNNPKDHIYDYSTWDFKFQIINDIIEQNNGKEYEIKW